MPIFEYQCRECDAVFEKIVFGNESAPQCPRCRSRELERLFSSFAVAGDGMKSLEKETGPCACGAPQRGMCGRLA